MATRWRRRGPARDLAGWRVGAVAVGLLIVAALTAIDAVSAPGSIVISSTLLAPLVVALLAGPRETAVVAAVAVVVAIVSGAWHHNFDTAAYYRRWIVVLVGGGLAVLAAAGRERIARDRERFALLAGVAEAADGRLTLEQTAAHVGELVVPALADICIFDVVSEGALRRLAVKAAGPAAAQLEARLLKRAPPAPGQPGSGSVAAAGSSQLLTAVSDELLGAGAHDAADLDLLRSLSQSAGIVVPLPARGRILGAVTLLLTERSHRRYTTEDLRFVEVLAGRVALAFDNAGLFTELETMEAQLTTALGALSEAVTVQNPRGNLIYANRAAAELLGYSSPRELLDTPPADVAQQYESFREDGSPLSLSDLPSRRVMEGEEPEPLVVRVVDRRSGEQRWRRTTSSAVRDGAGQVRLVVNVIADITAVKRAELVQRLLADVSEVLSSSLDIHDTLQRVAEVCVPELADWCAVSMPNEHHQLRAVAVAHSDPDKVALAQRFGERYPVDLDEPEGAARVFREAEPTLVNDITDEMLVAAASDEEHLGVLRGLGMHAALAVPMSTHGRTVGVLTLISAESGRGFGEEDVSLASELARRAATAIDNARLYTERSRIADTLQASLLPYALPQLPGWGTASLYRPAGDEERVGGDFYEGFPLSEDRWMLLVGDVTGRGAPAAALTALMRHTLRAVAKLTGSATQALDELNRELLARPERSLCTAVCLVLRERDAGARAEVICAGHPLPLLLRDGAAEYVGQFGPMLGAFADERWKPLTVVLHPGDILFLYSDGVLDAIGREDRFGPDRLERALTGATDADDAVARVERALSAFELGAQADDTAVLAAQWLGVPEPAARGADAAAARTQLNP